MLYKIYSGKLKLCMLPETIKNELIDSLKPIHPVLVILFGSYAWGIPGPDSDIDLYIVTDENIIPRNFEENLMIKKRVYLALSDFRDKYASDIIVHTLPVHQKFLELGSSFAREIVQKGIVLMDKE
jgi:uncharacterized protein